MWLLGRDFEGNYFSTKSYRIGINNISLVTRAGLDNSRASRPKFWTTVLPKRNRSSVPVRSGSTGALLAGHHTTVLSTLLHWQTMHLC